MTQEPDSGISLLWLELFFDLVVVAAMVVLATALEERTSWGGIGFFTLTFAAIWMAWSSFAMYTNLANEQAERRTIIAGMAAIAVMAASLLHLEARANVFAIGYLVCRFLATLGVRRSGRYSAAWAALDDGISLPWLVSLFVPAPWKYWLWALGLVLDLIRLWTRKDAEQTLARINERVSRASDRHRRVPSFVVVALREHHLTERLGTFVIIVLGESVMQLVRAASETEWSPQMWVATIASFGVIVGIWRQTFAYGFTAAPGGAHAEERLPAAMISHLVTTGSLVVLAAGLGETVRHAEGLVHQPWGWITAGALAVYLATSLVSSAGTRVGRRWIVGWGLPTTAVAVVAGLLAPLLAGWAFTLVLLLPVLWQVGYGRRPPFRRRGQAGGTAAAAGTPSAEDAAGP